MLSGWPWVAGVIAGAFALSWIGTRLALGWLRRRAVMDFPNERSSHVRPTPRGGGLGLVPAILLIWLVAVLPGGIDLAMALLILGLALLFAISFRDDVKSLAALPRLVAQIVAAGLALPWLAQTGPVFQGLLPSWLDAALALLMLVGFVNFFNFMDGIDGISGVEAGSIGLGGALVLLLTAAGGLTAAPGLEAMALGFALFGGALGFLAWNWHPAKLFLGDVGSVPLGYLTGLLCLTLAGAGYWVPALLLPAYYLADAGLTLCGRILRREKITQAHRSHFYQRAVRGGAGHAKVATAVANCQAVLVVASLASLRHPWPALLAGLLAVACLLVWLQRQSGRQTG